MRALSFVTHVGNHLREYDLHVYNRWVTIAGVLRETFGFARVVLDGIGLAAE